LGQFEDFASDMSRITPCRDTVRGLRRPATKVDLVVKASSSLLYRSILDEICRVSRPGELTLPCRCREMVNRMDTGEYFAPNRFRYVCMSRTKGGSNVDFPVDIEYIAVLDCG
jgi:hypothetical protein